jgi:hypothetical protein
MQKNRAGLALLLFLFLSVGKPTYGIGFLDLLNTALDKGSQVTSKLLMMIPLLERMNLIQENQRKELEGIHGELEKASHGDPFVQMIDQATPDDVKDTNSDTKEFSEGFSFFTGSDYHKDGTNAVQNFYTDTLNTINGSKKDREKAPSLSDEGKKNLEIKQGGQMVEGLAKGNAIAKSTDEKTARLLAIEEERLQKEKEREELIREANLGLVWNRPPRDGNRRTFEPFNIKVIR